MSNAKRKPARAGKSRRGGSSGGKWPIVLLGLLVAGGWYALHHGRQLQRLWNSTSRGEHEAGSIHSRTHRRERQGHIAGCGTERWSVKTLTDEDAGRIDMHPEDTTIDQLVAIRRPSHSAIPEDGRNPVEEHTYRVHARLLRYKLEKDQDIHMVLASTRDPRITMVAEIPAGSCTGNQHFGPLFDELRQDLSLRFGTPEPRFRKLPRNTRVVVTGVGFFDFLHGQSGMAPNGLELHPVINLSVE